MKLEDLIVEVFSDEIIRSMRITCRKCGVTEIFDKPKSQIAIRNTFLAEHICPEPRRQDFSTENAYRHSLEAWISEVEKAGDQQLDELFNDRKNYTPYNEKRPDSD